MMRLLLMFLLVLATGMSGVSGAAVMAQGSAADMPHFDNPAMRTRYQSLTRQLRCVICLNRSIASSTAPLAQQMRQLVAAKLHAGYTDAEIKDFMVQRYGTFVLYDPPFSAATWLLWFGPGVLLLIGLCIATVVIRRNRRAADKPLTVDHERLARLLDENEPGERRL